jgi:hypothetical protein
MVSARHKAVLQNDFHNPKAFNTSTVLPPFNNLNSCSFVRNRIYRKNLISSAKNTLKQANFLEFLNPARRTKFISRPRKPVATPPPIKILRDFYDSRPRRINLTTPVRSAGGRPGRD